MRHSRLVRLVVVLAGALAGCSSDTAAIDAPTTAWQLGPTLPRPALHPGVALLGQQVIVAGGLETGGAATARVDGFDVSGTVWQALPDAPVPRVDPQLTVIGATLYLAGGFDAATPQPDGYQLDPLDQRWKPIAAMAPADARGAAGVVAAPGGFYLIGGASATGVLASCLQYDLITDQWLHGPALPDLPVARSHPAVMRMTDGTLIVAGGFADVAGSQPLADVWALPPPGAVPREWLARTPVPPPAGARGDCAYGVVLGELVCAGGQAGAAPGGTVESAVEGYDPYLDVWTVHEPMPVPRTGTAGIAVGGRLFVPGGAATAALEPTDTLYVYTPLDTAARPL